MFGCDMQGYTTTILEGPLHKYGELKAGLILLLAFQAVLEDCISVQLPKETTEEACQTDQKAEEYSLAQLTELQNKLMLITTKAEQGREEANRFLEVSHSATPVCAQKTMCIRLEGFG